MLLLVKQVWANSTERRSLLEGKAGLHPPAFLQIHTLAPGKLQCTITFRTLK